MKLRFFLILTGFLLTLQNEIFAQSYAETAMLFSRQRPGGDARIQALGGAQTALGGNISSAYYNPAGLGMYNRSEFSITPGVSSFNTKASYLGTSASDNTSRLQIPNLGIVFNIPSNQDGGAFVGGSFAISLNRMNDFNRSITYQGSNPNNSIIQSFISNAFGKTTEAFAQGGVDYNDPTGLAYNVYLIGPASTIDKSYPDDEYFTDVQNNFEGTRTSNANQKEEIITKGSQNQWSFSYGANFLDKIFVGGGIGISSIHYKSSKTFTEAYPTDPVFSDLSLNENLDVKGSGFNVTLGVIARPLNFLQVGVSYTTPTYYQFSESYDATLNANWRNFDYYGNGQEILNNESAGTDIVTSDYNLTIPSRLSVGTALITKYGFLTLDYERSNIGNAKYSSNDSGVSLSADNDDIKSFYRSVNNLRGGVELRSKIWRLRGGYALMASAYKSSFDVDNKITSVSGGVGVKLDKFHIDFALIQSKGDNAYYQPYNFYNDATQSQEGPVAQFKNTWTTGMITIGFTY
jgi:hypothetical protein